MDRSRGNRRAGVLVAAALSAMLTAACGQASDPAPVAAQTSTAPTSEATPAAPTPTETVTAPPASATTSASPSVPQSRALPITAFADPGSGAKVAVIKSPTGNIVCDFAQDDSYAGCGVLSMIDPDAGARWWIELRGGAPERVFREDAPWSGNTDGSVQVVEYGTTVATLHYACRSEQTGMTCWNTKTGKGAHLARKGIDLVTMPVGEVAVIGDGDGSGEPGAATAEGNEEAVLSAVIPAHLVPNERPGRLKNGTYDDFDPEVGGERVWLKNGPSDDDDWRKRVSFVDVAGDDRKEAVVLLGRTNGGVPWADGIVVYDPDGGVVWSWDTADAGGEPRGNCTFTRLTDSSVDVNIGGTAGSGSAAEQRGMSTYRLSKGGALRDGTSCHVGDVSSKERRAGREWDAGLTPARRRPQRR